jgi:hypothetical protein
VEIVLATVTPVPQPETTLVSGVEPREEASQDLTAIETVRARRTVVGRIAHFVGLLVAALIGKALGATRPKRLANHHILEGMPFQIHTITGSQKTFTINPPTEPDPIIVAVRQRVASSSNMAQYQLFGVRKADVLPHSKRSASPGHAKSQHRQASITQVPKTPLGYALVPERVLNCETTELRFHRLAEIDVATPEQLARVVDEETCARVRSFIASVSLPSELPPTDPVPPSVAGIDAAAEPDAQESPAVEPPEPALPAH